MVRRWSGLAPLGVLLVVTSGCPEPDDEAGEAGETAFDPTETGETAGGTDETDTGRPDDTGDGDGDPDPDPTGGILPPPDTGDDDGFDDPNRCWDDTWNGTVLPHVILGSTSNRVDSSTGSCGIAAAPDFQLGFVAPWAGSFTFDTSGSSFDTVLYVHDGACGEVELACNDDFLNLDSRVVVQLAHAQIVTVSVDGTGPFQDGPFKLDISETVTPVCNAKHIPPNLPTAQLGNTSGATDQLASGCGGAGAPERVYQFVAPGPGVYAFNTFGSAFDTVLYTLDVCDGPPLACNDDAGFSLQSELIVALAGGQKLLVVVDGFGPGDSGPFVLNVNKL